MKKYIVRIDSATRRVLEFMSGPEFMEAVEIPGTTLLATDTPYPDDTAWIDIELMPHTRPAAPTPQHTWNWESLSWELTEEGLAKAKSSVRKAWNTWRDAQFAKGCLVEGVLYHAEDSFLTELLLILRGFETAVLPPDSVVSIRLKNNTSVGKTYAEIQALLAAISFVRQTTYSLSWAGKDALDDPALTLEQVLAMGPPNTV